MAVPRIVDDGDKRTAYPVGAGEFSTPFAIEGDFKTWELRITYRVDVKYYRRGAVMQKVIPDARYYGAGWGEAYLVEETEARPIGLGLVEFDRIYSVIPVTRITYTQVIAINQFYSESAGYDWDNPPDSPTIEDFPWPMNGKVTWEYGLKPFEVLIAPRAAIINGSLVRIGDWGQVVPGNEVLVQDSENGIYKGLIYYRRSIRVKIPNIRTSAP